MPSFPVTTTGAFSLEESATFGFGQRFETDFDGVMRMAFCLEADLATPVGVELRQRPDGVDVVAHGDADPSAVARQVARILSLDGDGAEFEAIGRRDPVIGRLQEVAPGLRPPLFHSPYEAAVWSVLSARRPQAQMAEVRRRLAEVHGSTFTLAGEEVSCLPSPQQLLEVGGFPGIPEAKLARIHAVARAALDGALGVDHLVAIGPDAAASELQRLPGIGPFYATLVVLRAVGFVDVMATEETYLPPLVAALYGLGAVPDLAGLAEIGERWRPMRTWCSVLVRAAGPRLLGPEAAGGPRGRQPRRKGMRTG